MLSDVFFLLIPIYSSLYRLQLIDTCKSMCPHKTYMHSPGSSSSQNSLAKTLSLTVGTKFRRFSNLQGTPLCLKPCYSQPGMAPDPRCRKARVLLSKASFQIFRISQGHQLIQSPFPKLRLSEWLLLESKEAPLYFKPSRSSAQALPPGRHKRTVLRGARTGPPRPCGAWEVGPGMERLPCC